MNLVLWLEVLIPRRNLLRKLLLSTVELPDDVKATMIQRFVFSHHTHLQKEWDYARVFMQLLADNVFISTHIF
jgi:hypothetical protein